MVTKISIVVNISWEVAILFIPFIEKRLVRNIVLKFLKFIWKQ